MRAGCVNSTAAAETTVAARRAPSRVGQPVPTWMQEGCADARRVRLLVAADGAVRVEHTPLVQPPAILRVLPAAALETAGGSADAGRTWIFKLRPGVKWHDGVPFTAKDVVFSLNAYASSPGHTGMPLTRGMVISWIFFGVFT